MYPNIKCRSSKYPDEQNAEDENSNVQWDVQYNLRILESEITGFLSPPDASAGPEFLLYTSLVKYTLETGIWEF